jgi:predicted lipoprotein with Yx(FWY)xxD motif
MGNAWKAVLADDGAKPMGNWTIIPNQDGTRQWAYKGKRLYTSTFDSVAGDLKGHRHGDDRAWRVMTRRGDCPDLC